MSSLPSGFVFDIRKFSVHDGPGIRTTVFFKGCPLDCWWCHNPESQSRQTEIMLWDNRCIRCGACVEVCPQGAIAQVEDSVLTDRTRCTRCGTCLTACPAEAREQVGRAVSVAEVMAEIERDVTFYDESGGGVTFSGGEPLQQRAFLLALLQACQTQEIHTVLDTSGYAAWETLDSVRGLVDLFLYDLKLMDDTRHRQYTGVSNHLILQNLRKLAELGHPTILRVPLIPGINDDEANLRALSELALALPAVQRVDLLPYHHAAAGKYDRLARTYRLPDTRPPTAEQVEALAQSLRARGLSVKIGG